MDDAPRFSNPPVAEVALAVQFDPIPGLLAVDLGAVRENFAATYPKVRQQPPLPPMAPGLGQPGIRLQLLNAPELPRTWFLSEDDSRLVQFQPDRLGVNWRRRSDEPYPHYETIRPAFVEAWEGLCSALATIGREAPVPTACEVLYLNPIESGDDAGWNGFGQLQNVVAPWSGAMSDSFLPAPAEVRLATRFLLPDDAGILEVDANPAQQRTTGASALMLQLRAVGKPLGEDFDGALNFMDLGHDWIIRAFASLTTEQMHERWGRAHD